MREGIKSIAVTAGYVCPEPRAEFYRHMDAVNIDLKRFTEEFYHKVCYVHLQPAPIPTRPCIRRVKPRSWRRQHANAQTSKVENIVFLRFSAPQSAGQLPRMKIQT